MNWKRLTLFLLLILAAALVACGPDSQEEATGRQSALAAMEPGAEVAAQDDEPLDDEDDLVGDEDDGEPLVDACTYSQGYWKNHPEDWDVESLTWNGVSYTQKQLLAYLNTAPQGDATIILAHQLIAAELNQANNAEPIEAIAQAKEWLQNHPLGTDPEADREEAIMLAETLDDYNNGLLAADACDEIEDDDEIDEIDEVEEVDDEFDEVDDEFVEGACTGADPHPHAQDLAARYEGATYEEIMDLFCQGYGFGEIEILYNLADETGLDVEAIMEMRADHMGWGQIRKEIGAAPGLGNGKPNPGNGGNPPGLNKDKDNPGVGNDKDDSARGNSGNPPGQTKDKGKDNPGLGNGGNPPGQDKDKSNPGRGNSQNNPGKGKNK